MNKASQRVSSLLLRKFSALDIVKHITPQELGKLILINQRLLHAYLDSMPVVLLINILSNSLPLSVLLSESLQRETDMELSATENHIFMERAQKRLVTIWVLNFIILDRYVYFIYSRFNLMVSVSWRELELQYQSIKLIHDKHQLLSLLQNALDLSCHKVSNPFKDINHKDCVISQPQRSCYLI